MAPRERTGLPDEYWPGIQGLRAVAVVGVLAYHHDPTLIPGGFLGVSLFFTLSGFLVTNLVLRERRRTGGLAVPAFWARRARRLLPVATLGLVVALAVGWVEARNRLGSLGGDVRAAALNVANWRFAFAEVSYGDAVADPSPVAHYWSLAIEEQFYLVFPVLAMVCFRSRRPTATLASVLLVVSAASVAAQLAIGPGNRAYLGTDTRALELAVGGLAAIGWLRLGNRAGRSRGWFDVLGVLAGAALLTSWATVGLDTRGLWRGGLAAHAVGSVAVVLAAIAGRWVPRALSARPLLALGARSYGIYVFHFPLFLLLDGDRTGLDGAALLAVRVVATLAVAEAVGRLVEDPVRRGGALPGWRAALALPTAIVAVLALASGSAAVGDRSTTTVDVAAAEGPTIITFPPAPVESVAPEPVIEAPGPVEGAVRAPATAPSSPDPAPPPSSAPAPPPPAPPTPPASPPRLLVVGDSTALANGVALRDWGVATGRATVDVVAHHGCSFHAGRAARLRVGWDVPVKPGCRDLLSRAASVAAANGADAIVVFTGSIQLADWLFGDDVVPRSIGEPAFDADYRRAAHAALAELEGVGVPVLLATVPVPDWDPVVSFGVPVPGSGPLTINDPVRAARLAQLNAEVVGAHPLVRLVPYAEVLEGPDGTVDPALRPDGLHLSHDAVLQIADQWLEAMLIAGYRDVLATVGDAVAVARPTTWR